MKVHVHLLAALLLGLASTVTSQDGDLVTVLIEVGFNTLVRSAANADLVDALLAPEPRKTLFAPTDFAFSSLPEPLFAFLNRPEGKTLLTEILLYHLLDSELFEADLLAAETVTTLSGDSLTITNENELLVNDATVIASNVPTSNGVIHVIDGKIGMHLRLPSYSFLSMSSNGHCFSIARGSHFSKSNYSIGYR